jgi:hypothetical protein
MDREQALLCLKWIATQHIDGYWGAGDAHLFALQLIMALDPDDERIRKLYERLEEKAKTVEKGDFYEEAVYRDEGKEEAEFYMSEIERKYGKEFADRLAEFYMDWMFG